MKQLKAKILQNEEIARGFYRMRVASPYLAKNAKPGQFVEVRCSDGVEPLLRRPLGCHRISKSGIDLLYELVGKGTELLSRKKDGEYLDVIGPLGKGFGISASKSVILVAGGVGAAPLLALAEKLRGQKTEVSVLIGACKRSHILCEKEFKKLGCKVGISTDDGSAGRKGFVTDLLNNLLTTYNLSLTTIYACGPNAMLKEVARIAEKSGVPCQVSLEERMACGVGVCLGCPVKIKNSKFEIRNSKFVYKMVCKDGPVFDAKEIAW